MTVSISKLARLIESGLAVRMSFDLVHDSRKLVGAPFGLMGEFRQFISRGNVVDLAVGVIIGGAFSQITNSLVNDIVMPPISYLLSGVDVKSWSATIHAAILGPDGKVIKPAVLLTYGNFLQTCLNFLIIAFVIFAVIKLINQLKRQEAAQPSAPPAPSAEETLLREIRDSLQARPIP